MTPKAISRRPRSARTFDVLQDWPGDLSAASYAASELSYQLAGQYSFRAEKAGFEIELIDIATLWRSVIYVRPQDAPVVFLPAATYRFFIRSLGPVPGRGAKIVVQKLGFLQKIAFFSQKALSFFCRPPADSLAAVKILMAQLAGRGSASGVTAIQGNRVLNRPRDVEVAKRPEPEAAADGGGGLAVSIIIPTKERLDLLRGCIGSLDYVEDVTFEVIIVDNGATSPEMLAYLADQADRDHVRVLRRDIPFNFSRLCNDGAKIAQYPLLLFLNDDIEALDGHWLADLRRFAARDDIGVVGARLLYPSRHLQHGGIAVNLLPGPGHPWRGVAPEIWQNHPLLNTVGEVDAVTGACLMIRTSLFFAVGGFDEADFAVTLNDVDLCLKVRGLGLKVVYVPNATLLHKESQTRRRDDRPEEAERYGRELAAFYRRHEAVIRTSSFYPDYLRRDSDQALTI